MASAVRSFPLADRASVLSSLPSEMLDIGAMGRKEDPEAKKVMEKLCDSHAVESAAANPNTGAEFPRLRFVQVPRASVGIQTRGMLRDDDWEVACKRSSGYSTCLYLHCFLGLAEVLVTCLRIRGKNDAARSNF